ncbi:hypothetical protein RFI_35817, partial [Reticulomyxa filosa]
NGIINALDKLNFKQAIQLFCLALYVKLQTLHYSHIDGRAHDNKGEYGKATKLYKKSLKIKLDIFESDHIDIATLYNDLGYVYCNKKEYNKTIEYFENALKVCKNIFENLDERMLLGRKGNGRKYTVSYLENGMKGHYKEK